MSPLSLYTTTVMFAGTILYPIVTAEAVSMLFCIEVDGESYLASDLRVSCDAAAHGSYRILAVLAVVVVTIGLPLGSFLLLYQFKEELDSVRARRRLYFLFSGYRKEMFGHESVIMLRKAALVSIASLPPTVGPDRQFTLGVITLVVALTIQLYTHPHEDKMQGRLEQTSILASLACLLLGQLILNSSDASNEAFRVAASVFIMVATLGTMLFGLGLIAWDVYQTAVSAQLAERMQRALKKLELRERRQRGRVRAQTSLFHIASTSYSSSSSDEESGNKPNKRGSAGSGAGGVDPEGQGDEELETSWILQLAACIQSCRRQADSAGVCCSRLGAQVRAWAGCRCAPLDFFMDQLPEGDDDSHEWTGNIAGLGEAGEEGGIGAGIRRLQSFHSAGRARNRKRSRSRALSSLRPRLGAAAPEAGIGQASSRSLLRSLSSRCMGEGAGAGPGGGIQQGFKFSPRAGAAALARPETGLDDQGSMSRGGSVALDTDGARSAAGSSGPSRRQSVAGSSVAGAGMSRRASVAAAAEAMLVWRQMTHPVSGQVYWYNTHSKETSWEKPRVLEQAAQQKAKEDAAWRRKAHPANGLPYWYNAVLQQTQWQRPAEFPV